MSEYMYIIVCIYIFMYYIYIHIQIVFYIVPRFRTARWCGEHPKGAALTANDPAVGAITALWLWEILCVPQMWNNHNLCRDIFCGKFTEQKHPELRCTTEFTLAI